MKRIYLTLLLFISILTISFSQTCISNASELEEPFFAADFERNSYVRISNGNDDTRGMQVYHDEDFTVDIWVYPQFSKDASNYYFIYSYGKWDDDHNSFFVAFESKDHSGDKWAIRVSDGNDDGSNSDLLWKFTPDYYEANFHNKWTHICVVLDSPSDKDGDATVKLYVNGSYKSSQTGFDMISYGSGDSEISYQKYSYLGEGLSPYTSYNEAFYGYMSGLRLWDRALTSTEIQYVKNKTFFDINSFIPEYQYLFNSLRVNMYRDVNNNNNIASTTYDALGIGMVEYNIPAHYNEHHPANPVKPYNLTLTENCDNIYLHWDKSVFSGTSAILRRQISPIEEYDFTLLCQTNADYYQDNSIEKETEYEYKVESRWYNPDNPLNTVQGIYISEGELIRGRSKAYAYPRNFSVEDDQTCNGKLVFSWTESSEAIYGYSIFSKTSDESWNLVTDITDKGTTNYAYDVPDQQYGEPVTYAIEARNDGCTYFEDGGDVLARTNKPCTENPQNITASEEAGNIRIDWDFTQPASALATGFRIYRRVVNGNTILIDELENQPNVRIYIDESAGSCIEYEYMIQAVNSCTYDTHNGESAWSAGFNKSLDFTDVFIPESIDASKGYFNDRVVLEWAVDPDQRPDINAFEIYRKSSKANSFTLLSTVTNPNATEYVDKDLDANVLYQYKIIARAECNSSYEYSEEQFTEGFRTNVGIVSGKTSFAGGNAVQGVEIRVESNYFSPSHCIYQDGSTEPLYFVKTLNDLDSLQTKPFGFEAWIKPERLNFTLLSAGAFKLYFLEGIPVVKIAEKVNENIFTSILSGSDAIPTGQWTHVAINVSPTEISLFVNGQQKASKTAGFRSWTAVNITGFEAGDTTFVIGIGDNNYKGYLDEVRFWNTERPEEDIYRDYKRILTGEEKDLISYLRMDEGFGNSTYDVSNIRGNYHKNHFAADTIIWSTQVPPEELLHVSGITDEYGNYKISSIRYDGSGGTFRIIPMLGVHEFDPADIELFIGDNSPVHNKIDFTDISSFVVKGKIVYEGTNFPVKDVYIKVDGDYVKGADNMPVATKEDGTYQVDVPIGQHYIEVEKNGHTFISAYYPGKDSNGDILKHYFNVPIDNLNFYDKTRVKLIGKVVGGPVEAAKQSGSVNNPAKNNLGVVEITLTSLGEQYNLPNGKRDTTFYTSPNDGNFEIDLLPEVYKPKDALSIGNTTYKFNRDEDLTTIDLRNVFNEKYVVDSVYETNPDGSETLVGVDTVLIYNQERNWIWRNTPELEVYNGNGSSLLGDSIILYDNGLGEYAPLIIASTASDGMPEYKFGHPSYTMGNPYSLLIVAIESYENNDQPEVVDKVPVTDGEVYIMNDCAVNSDNYSIGLNEEGYAIYRFSAGMPNLANPYTHNMDIQLMVDNVAYQWSEAPLVCYVFGAVPTGNNFVTKGPDKVDFILRDPPGSNSYAFFEEGFTTTEVNTTNLINGWEQETSLVHMLGVRIATQAGSPFFSVQNEFKSDNSIGVTVQTGLNWGTGSSESTTVTYNQGFSTSESADYVGDMGDVFFGRSTNMIYGLATFLQVLKPGDALDQGTLKDSVDFDGTTYCIGQRKGLRMSPEVKTTFVYTQNHIENALIPNLIMLRNLFFTSHPGNYVSHVVSQDDSRYLSNNDDEILWGSDATPDDPHNGLSYTYMPDNDAEGHPKWDSDSVRFYNQQIAQWESKLRLNEKQKVKAKKFKSETGIPENVSFDAGTSYEASIENSVDSTETSSFEYEMNAGLALELGFSINKFGFRLETKQTWHLDYTHDSETTTTQNNTVGFVLADEDAGDYYTVDIRECQSGNGPVFRTRGGQSSCPYEGVTLSKYYKPGEVLNEATMQIEKPSISAPQQFVSGVPETEPAVFTLELANTSETNDDGWYILMADPSSNPDGAKIYVDGTSMGAEGKAILLPAGKTIYKTVEVYKGKSDVDEYNDLAMIIHSQCQFDPTNFWEDIADTVLLSAHFVPSCSPVNLAEPLDQWIVNADMNDTLPVLINGYNLQHERLKSIGFQYKPQSSSTWTTLYWWVNDPLLANNDAVEDTFSLSGSSNARLQWNMSELRDRAYDLRAVTYCNDGNKNYSDVKAGILDGIRPSVFGHPQPSDGILSAGEDISVQFSEEIETGLLTSENFVVKGVLNGYEIDHQASLGFDGSASYATVPAGVNLSYKSFTLEFWAKTTGDGTFFSYGSPDQSVGLEISGGNSLTAYLGTESASGSVSTDTENWHHYAFVYDLDGNRFKIYLDDEEVIIHDMPDTYLYGGNGPLNFGTSLANVKFLNGNMHDVRIYSEARNLSVVYSEMYNAPAFTDPSLIGYWPMDDATGTLAEDIAENRHAEINGAEWSVDPKGKAVNIGSDSYISLDATLIPVSQDEDYTIEFWFKADIQSDTAALFSCGIQGKSRPEHCLEIAALPNGHLMLGTMNGNMEITSFNTFDNTWHKFALTVSRIGEAKVYLDGEITWTVTNSQVNGFAGYEILIGAIKRRTASEFDGEVMHYFNGLVDEMRIWNAEIKENELSLNSNNRLTGSETGLIAYYPFEQYEKDNFDQLVQHDSKTDASKISAEAIFTGSVTFSDDAPNIKDVKPAEEVPVIFTANGDKIILTPDVDPERIEKCILDISVVGVEDLHGNSIASPAKWSAYVHQNNLLWSSSEVEAEKMVGETGTFDVLVYNKGGAVESFLITNLPDWLTVNESSGSIDPESEKHIEFTISGALNIGDYQTAVYLTSTDGFDEKLNVNVKVRGEDVKWSIEDQEFEYSMSVFGKLIINGQVSTDIDDRVGAFVGDECRGVCNLKYYSDYNIYLVPIQIYANKEGETVTFKVWDASTGRTHGNVTPELIFQADDIMGRPSTPIEIIANDDVEDDIIIDAGWNWLSFNLETDTLCSVDGLMKDVKSTTGDIIKGSTAFDNYVTGLGWNGSLSAAGGLEIGKLYMMKNSYSDNLIYYGISAKTSDYPIVLQPGWSWIGYVPQTMMPVNDALAYYTPQTDDLIKGRTRFAMYDPVMGWIGSLEYLEPNKGYMYYSGASENVSFLYPEQSLYTKGAVMNVNSNLSIIPAEYSNSMNIVAEVVGMDSRDYNLMVYTGDNFRGIVEPEIVNGVPVYFLSVGGENGDDSELRFELSNGQQSIELFGSGEIQLGINQILGTVKSPVQLFTEDARAGFGNSGIYVYPNPFASVVDIFVDPSKAEQIIIQDMAGRTVKVIQIDSNRVTWNGTDDSSANVAPGSYMVKVQAGSEETVIKLIKL
ncbi:LamG-like jellyroll fold domain-containing protein [Saccharicrinis sp. FJH62]|uniref:LamG-like jellyroll fold domain-containing protein n=1 Tax=Saccharicrinis sp. FJH62 TaxID=3344657 RepID=UPI0035D42040